MTPPSPGRFPLSLAAQIGGMKTKFPHFQFSLSRNTVEWIGMLKPTALSPSYLIRILYTLKRNPKVYVLDPPLELAEGKDELPHTYAPDDRLCLHYPPYGQWRPNKLIAGCIVPWISLWLCFYETWLATGKWFGEGIEHGGPKTER